MKSPFLLGVVGFLIVFGTLVGGLMAGLALHEWLTPQIAVMQTVWLWLGMAPFMWICSRTLTDHPISVGWYLGLLAVVVVADVVARQFGNRHDVRLAAGLVSFMTFQHIAGERQRRREGITPT